MANQTSGKDGKGRELVCSFCGRTQNEVEQLIIGPGVNICKDCLDMCNNALYKDGTAPHPAPGWLCEEIVSAHPFCPSALTLLSFQDWLSIDEDLRLPDANAERINIPANPRHYWRYRMHVNIEDLINNKEYNDNIKELVRWR